jgi:anthranilate synthase component 1
LICQAGAGIVVASKPESELEEVNNKLGALKKAIELAETLNKEY